MGHITVWHIQPMTSNCDTPNCHTFSKIVTLFPFFCFIIVQKWYLLDECSQIVTFFWSFFWKKCDNLRSWTVWIIQYDIANKVCNPWPENRVKVLHILKNGVDALHELRTTVAGYESIINDMLTRHKNAMSEREEKLTQVKRERDWRRFL